MEIKDIMKRTGNFINKFRYAIIILLIGILLMMWPSGEKEESTPKTEPVVSVNETTKIQEDLSRILSQVSGAGRVEVLLTESEGEQTLYQIDCDVSSDGTNDKTKESTIIVSDAQREEKGLVRQILPPKYQGAIIVCDGADSPSVRLAIVEAVSKITGLGTDRICVLKMK